MMRRALLIVLSAFVLGISMQAGAAATQVVPSIQGPPPSGQKGPTREIQQARGSFDLDEAKSGISPMMVFSFVLIFGILFVVMVVVFKNQARELELPENERELAAVARASGARSVGLGPKETVYGALLKANGWVTPGRISLSSGLSAEEVESFLGDLITDGRAKSGRDKQGRRLYRVVT